MCSQKHLLNVYLLFEFQNYNFYRKLANCSILLGYDRYRIWVPKIAKLNIATSDTSCKLVSPDLGLLLYFMIILGQNDHVTQIKQSSAFPSFT